MANDTFVLKRRSASPLYGNCHIHRGVYIAGSSPGQIKPKTFKTYILFFYLYSILIFFGDTRTQH